MDGFSSFVVVRFQVRVNRQAEAFFFSYKLLQNNRTVGRQQVAKEMYQNTTSSLFRPSMPVKLELSR